MHCLGRFCDGPVPAAFPGAGLFAGLPQGLGVELTGRLILSGRRIDMTTRAHMLAPSVEPGVLGGAVSLGYDYLFADPIPLFGVRVAMTGWYGRLGGADLRGRPMLGPTLSLPGGWSLRGGALCDGAGVVPEAAMGLRY